jgi:hypothetical protein
MICGDRVTGDEPRAAVGPEEHSAAVKDAPQTLSLSTWCQVSFPVSCLCSLAYLTTICQLRSLYRGVMVNYELGTVWTETVMVDCFKIPPMEGLAKTTTIWIRISVPVLRSLFFSKIFLCLSIWLEGLRKFLKTSVKTADFRLTLELGTSWIRSIIADRYTANSGSRFWGNRLLFVCYGNSSKVLSFDTSFMVRVHKMWTVVIRFTDRRDSRAVAISLPRVTSPHSGGFAPQFALTIGLLLNNKRKWNISERFHFSYDAT